MKAKRILTIAEITAELDNSELDRARTNLYQNTGSTVRTSGTILKVIRRGELPKLFIQTESLKVFATLPDIPEDLKLRKGLSVTVNGNLQSFGCESVCLDKCQIVSK